jgi:type IV pilus assembly protein PilB
MRAERGQPRGEISNAGSLLDPGLRMQQDARAGRKRFAHLPKRREPVTRTESHAPTVADILDDRQLAAYQQALSREQGLILAVGPTYSGKAALLYHGMRMLRRLRGQYVPMATVEWVVRGSLEDATRVVVSRDDGLTADSALKRLADQGTKAFLVGEIRDLAIADEAVRLTTQRRRLILSTLHTVDAPHALERLLNYGVRPEALAESVVLIFALRAFRKLCPACKKPLRLPAPSLRAAGFSEREIADSLTLWEPSREGCGECDRGFRARHHVCQMLQMTDAVRAALPEGDIREIRRVATHEGMKPLRRELLEAVKAGNVWLPDIEE